MLAAEAAQIGEDRLDVAVATAQGIVEFVEDQDAGHELREQKIDLLALGDQVACLARRGAQRMQDRRMEMDEASAFARLHHPNPLPLPHLLDLLEMRDREAFRDHACS